MNKTACLFSIVMAIFFAMACGNPSKESRFNHRSSRSVPSTQERGKPSSPIRPRGSTTTKVDAIIYGASWCEACHVAVRYFKAHHISYIEKDIEEDDDAYKEMFRKLRAAGVSSDSIPVIDFRGHILRGFDPDAIEALIRSGSTYI